MQIYKCERACRIEQFLDTDLVTLDDRAEMYCLMKYILDQYPSEAAAQYAIGLQSPDDYPGV